MRRLALLLAALLALACVLALSCRPRTVHPRFIRDAQGGALILHGANVSTAAKGDPLRIPSWLTRDDVLRLRDDWGFNFARYLILWDRLEPAPGVHSQDYLDDVEAILDWFAEAGIHVVIDMHQDVYSRVFCCDGAPEWAIWDDGLRAEPGGFVQRATWFLNYFEPAVKRAWDNFWDHAYRPPGVPASEPHLQDRYAAAWAAVAARFAGHPAVLGYDIMNEPFPGSDLSGLEFIGAEDPTGPSPAFDREKLQPFYERVIAALRAVDAESWIFFEPRYGAPGGGTRSYLGVLDDPRPGEPRLAYFPHLYSIEADVSGVYPPGDRTVANWSRNRAREVAAQDAPLLLGEWGAPDSHGNVLRYLEDVARMADRLTSGWAYWDYTPDPGGFGFIDGDKREKPGKMRVLVRTYPQRVAGTPVAYDYDPESRAFWLFFREEPGVTGPSEIYVPATRFYPQGFTLRSTDPDGAWRWEWDPAREIARVWSDPAQPSHLLWLDPL